MRCNTSRFDLNLEVRATVQGMRERTRVTNSGEEHVFTDDASDEGLEAAGRPKGALQV